MKPNFKKMTPQEKATLKHRIYSSLQKEGLRIRSVRWALPFYLTAACFVAMVGGGWLYFQIRSPESDIERYAALYEDGSYNQYREVRLVLSDQQAVEVQDESAIVYNAAGTRLKINNDRVINQSAHTVQEEKFNTVLVPYGRRTQVSLPDGTHVWLNSGSKLVYPTQFVNDSRTIYLAGEAVLEVSTDPHKPFLVKTDACDVQVLGTVFDVRAYPEDKTTVVALKEGKVRLFYDKTNLFGKPEQLDIMPDMVAVYDRDDEEMTSTQTDASPYLSWRDGYVSFKHSGVVEILARICRNYNVYADLEDVKNLPDTFSGNLMLSDDLNKVLQSLEVLTPYQYSFSDRKITVRRK